MKKIIVISCFLSLSLPLVNIAASGAAQEASQVDEYLAGLIKNAPTAAEMPGMPAVYLFLNERDTINEDGTAEYEIHVAWKMLSSQAIPMGEVSIPFNASNSTLEIKSARTITPNNTVVDVAEENIREVIPYSGFPLYSNTRFKQFSMPAMEVGSVIEYKAVCRLSRADMPGLFYSYWSFPPGIPVVKSVFEVDIPAAMEGNYTARNLDVKPEIGATGGRKTYKWTAENIFIGGIFEQFLPPYEVVCPNLTFATAKEWGDVAKWFRGISAPQLEPSPEMKEFAQTIMKRKGNDRHKVMEALFNFVSRDIRYVAIPLKSSAYKPHKATEIYTNKYGDCKDKSALLISLYKIAGIDAHFALLKTRSAGLLVKEFPALDFNHCVVAVPREGGGYIFLDPTLELCRFGYVHTDMQDVDIFVVKDDGFEFVKLPVELENIGGITSEIEMKIEDTHVIGVREKATYYGDLEIATRLNTKYSTRDAARAFFEEAIQALFTKGKLTDIDFSDPDDLDEQFAIEFNYTIEDYIKEAGNLLIFDLPTGGNLNVAVSAEERTYPLWLPMLKKNDSIINVAIPPGHKINFLPPDVDRDTPFGHLKREISGSEGKIRIKNYYREKMLVIPPEQYKAYKEFIGYVTKATKESIVLEKIKGSDE